METKRCKIEVKQEGFFEKVIVKVGVGEKAWLEEAISIVKLVIKFYSINEENVEDIHIEKIDDNHLKITIEYRKVSVSDLTKSEDMKDKIIAVLKYLEYSDDDIKSVSEINSLTWHAVIRDTYDPDESFSKRDEETSLQKLLWKIFNQPILVTIA